MVTSISSKKRTKIRRIVVKMNSFVCFLEEFTSWQFAFEINWHLKSSCLSLSKIMHPHTIKLQQRFALVGIGKLPLKKLIWGRVIKIDWQFMDFYTQFVFFLRSFWNGILLTKLFWPTYCEKKIVLVIEKNIWNSKLKAKNLQNFEITKTIYSNSERSEHFLVTECFFNLFLEVSQI